MSQLGTHVSVICWDEIFIIEDLQACMCWRCVCVCLNTSHQYHSSALPLTGIRVPSEEITVLNCPSCIFMLVYHNAQQTKRARYHQINMQLKQTEWFWYNQLKYDTASLRNYCMTAHLHNRCPQRNVITSDYVNLFDKAWWKS